MAITLFQIAQMVLGVIININTYYIKRKHIFLISCALDNKLNVIIMYEFQSLVKSADDQ